MGRYTFVLPIIFCFIQSGFGQCLQDATSLIPDTATPAYTSFGSEMDVYEGTLLVSDRYNDTLAYNGGIAYVYQLNDGGTQTKLATLSPGEPADTMYFGRKLALHENTIAIVSGELNSPTSNQSVYVFKKPDGEAWEDSNETIIIQLSGPDVSNLTTRILGVDVNEHFLAVYYHHRYYDENFQSISEYGVNIYSLSGGISLETEIPLPKDPDGQYGSSYYSDIAFADKYLAVSATETYNFAGATYVYYYDETDGWSTSPDLTLIPPPDANEYYYSGTDIEVRNNDLFVANQWTQTSSNERISHVFFYSGESILSGVSVPDHIYGFPTSSTDNRINISTNDDYLILKRSREAVISGYKRETTWGEEGTSFTINLSGDSGYLGINNEIVISEKNIMLDVSNTGMGQQSRVNVYHHPEGNLEQVSFSRVISAYSYLASDDFFGQALSVSLSHSVVGAPGDDDSGESRGAVYYYQRTAHGDWEFHSKILPTKSTEWSQFGAAVKVTDHYLFVSDPSFDSLNGDGSVAVSRIGKVYQYKLTDTGWVLENQIVSPEFANISNINDYADERKYFGRVLEYHNGYLAIGQYNAGSSVYVGNVYVFKYDSIAGKWDYKATLNPRNPTNLDFFGGSISMSDSLIVAGRYSGKWANNGNLLVFEKKGDEWTDAHEDAVLNTGDGFALSSCIINNDMVLAGVPTHVFFSDNTTGSKLVQVFEKPDGGWSGDIKAQRFLKASDPIGVNDFFGYAIHATSNYVFVGEPKNYSPGEVYVYEINAVLSNDSIIYESKVLIENPVDGSEHSFGNAIDGNSTNDLFVGSFVANTSSGPHSGAVYAYNSGTAILPLDEPLCSDQQTVKLNSFPAVGGVWEGVGIVDGDNGTFDPGVAGAGKHEVTYTNNGCSLKMSIEVYDPPQILARAPSLIKVCEGEQARLYVDLDQTGYTYEWYYREDASLDYQQLTATNEAELITSLAGEYYCHVLTPFCTVEDAHFTLMEKSSEGRLNYTGSLLLCKGETVDLNVRSDSEVSAYSWYFSMDNAVFDLQGDQSEWKNVDESGSYFCQYVSEGCTYFTDTLNVINLQVDIEIADIPVICERDHSQQVQVTPKGGILSLAGAVLPNNEINPQLMENGIYELHYEIDTLGCHFSATREVEITITDIDDLFIPNAFTPNNDGVNETFHIRSSYYNFDEFRLIITDRNGSEVFSTQTPDFKWNGEGRSSGVYYWFLTLFNSCTNQTHSYKGYVQLMR